MTEMTWDPTGRYLVTQTIGRPIDNGYMIWSFTGEPLQRYPIEGFRGLRWRPRPPSLLTPEDYKVR